jgi:foldase protein PrsA
MSKLRLSLLLCALALPALLVAGCGGVPGNAVATVDGEAIPKNTFDHWMNVAAKQSGTQPATVPDAPEYTRCVAAKKKAAGTPKKGAKPTPDSTYESQCKQEYEALRNQVLNLLITSQWIEGEAVEQNVKVTDAQVKKLLADQKKQSFKKDADYQKYLKQSGQAEEDLLLQYRVRELSTKIQDKVVKGKDKVTDAQIAEYYEKNKSRYATPETRDMRVVLTRGEANAEKARAALADGDSWGEVAKKYSIDDTTKDKGGKLTGVAKGQSEASLDKAVFAADKGELSQPVKTQFGYYVFEVGKVKAAKQQSLDQVKATIKQTIATERQQKALQGFVTSFRKRWREKTECRDGFKSHECKNGPKATPTPGAQQQQQQQQQTAPTPTPTPAR